MSESPFEELLAALLQPCGSSTLPLAVSVIVVVCATGATRAYAAKMAKPSMKAGIDMNAAYLVLPALSV